MLEWQTEALLDEIREIAAGIVYLLNAGGIIVDPCSVVIGSEVLYACMYLHEVLRTDPRKATIDLYSQVTKKQEVLKNYLNLRGNGLPVGMSFTIFGCLYTLSTQWRLEYSLRGYDPTDDLLIPDSDYCWDANCDGQLYPDLPCKVFWSNPKADYYRLPPRVAEL